MGQTFFDKFTKHNRQSTRKDIFLTTTNDKICGVKRGYLVQNTAQLKKERKISVRSLEFWNKYNVDYKSEVCMLTYGSALADRARYCGL